MHWKQGIIMSDIKIEGIISEMQLAEKLKEMKGSDKIILETTVDNMKDLINYDEVIKKYLIYLSDIEEVKLQEQYNQLDEFLSELDYSDRKIDENIKY